MKKLFLTFLLLVFLPMSAHAQWVGPGQQTITVSSPHTLGDGSTTQGGIAPGLSNGSNPYELADIADNFSLTGWTSGAGSRTPNAAEAKARFHCHVSHELQADPILYPGQVNGHLHTFFGNTLANKDSTYTSLRTTGWSTCSGGPINRTAYWFPSVRRQLSTGAYVTIKPERIIAYYVGNSQGTVDTRIPRGFRYVSGYDATDPDNTPLKTAILAANSAAGWTRYSFYGSGSPTQANTHDGFKGWRCDNSTYPATSGVFVPYLVDENGNDMFVQVWGSPCGAGRISFVVDAPRCWDGKNISSANGRRHVSHVIHDNNDGNDYCPTGWYFIPNFEGSFIFTSNGPSDYMTWFFSSDRMLPSNTAADATNRSPCRRVSYKFCNGETGHFDWFGAWSYGTEASPSFMLRWMKDCPGIKTYPSVTPSPADCVDNTVDSAAKLLGNAETVPSVCLSDSTCPKQNPGAGNYQVWLSKPDYSTWVPQRDRYFPLTPGVNGALNAVGGHGDHGP